MSILSSLKEKVFQNKWIPITSITTQNPPWDQTQDYSNLLLTIRDSPASGSEPMGPYLERIGKTARFNGEVYVVELDNRLKVAFKTCEDVECAHAEALASRLSDWFHSRIGRHYIPPTVVRTFEFGNQSKVGACSYFVETDLDLWKPDQFKQAMTELDPIDQANGSALIYLMSQWDNHPGNWLAPIDGGTKKRRVVLIDNEGLVNYSTGEYGERPWVSVAFSEKTPRDLVVDYSISEQTTEEQFATQIAGYGFDLPQRRITAIYNNLVNRGEQSRELMISCSRLLIKHHQNNPNAFPNYTPILPQDTIEAMRSLTIFDLQQMGSDLIETDPKRFDPRQVSDFFPKMLTRRDQILTQVRPM